MYSANVFNVIIVSPNDVQKERNVAKEVILDWNVVNSSRYRIVLQPTGWDINSYPEMSGEPQKILNKQLLDNADMLVGIFWTRIGTETKDFISGTVEEISLHVDSGKPAMLYFSSVAVAQDSIDSKQYSKLIEYKNSIQDKGYFFVYETIPQFTNLFARHLALTINGKPDYFKIPIEFAANPNVSNRHAGEETIIDQIGDNEKTLLKEASKDSGGTIIKFYSFAGLALQTNGKSFGSEKRDPRFEAELEHAIESLEQLGLIGATSYKRDVFRVTAKGYSIADILQ